jgi:hypothetical protein
MPGLMPGIHAFLRGKQDVDGRDKPGHDGYEANADQLCQRAPDVNDGKPWSSQLNHLMKR